MPSLESVDEFGLCFFDVWVSGCWLTPSCSCCCNNIMARIYFMATYRCAFPVVLSQEKVYKPSGLHGGTGNGKFRHMAQDCPMNSGWFGHGAPPFCRCHEVCQGHGLRPFEGLRISQTRLRSSEIMLFARLKQIEPGPLVTRPWSVPFLIPLNK